MSKKWWTLQLSGLSKASSSNIGSIYMQKKKKNLTKYSHSVNWLYTVAFSMKIGWPLQRQPENDFCAEAVILLKNSTGKHHLSIRITSKTSISLSVNIRAKGMLTWAANRLQSVLRRLDMHVHKCAHANPNTFTHTQTDGHGASSQWCFNYSYF